MLQTMSDMPIYQTALPRLDALHHQRTAPAALAQCCQSKATRERLCGRFTSGSRWGSEGHAKKEIRLKQFDMCLIHTRRGQDTVISNFKDSLAAV